MKMPRTHILTPEHEKMLWDKKELNMETSRGLSRTVIFYLIKCFAVWQAKDLQQLNTSQVSFGEDDLGLYVALNLQEENKLKKRYDDPANPRSVYKILRKYQSYVANEGPFLVRPIPSIKNYICYSPLPVGMSVIERIVSTLTKDAGISTVYHNYSLNLQAVDTLIRFGTGSHCLASWLFKNGLKGMSLPSTCGQTNCEDSNPEISLMMSRLLDPPYPFDAMDLIRKMELEEEEPKLFDLWMTNLMSKKLKEMEKQNKQIETEKENNTLVPIIDKNGKNRQSKNNGLIKLSDSDSGHCSERSDTSSSSLNIEGAFQISCISSISEGAFSIQVDEAERVETNTSIIQKIKRKKLKNSNDKQSLLKKLKLNSSFASYSSQTADGIADGNTQAKNDTKRREDLKECSKSHGINKSLVTEVKREIVTDDVVVVDFEEEKTNLKSGSPSCAKYLTNSNSVSQGLLDDCHTDSDMGVVKKANSLDENDMNSTHKEPETDLSDNNEISTSCDEDLTIDINGDSDSSVEDGSEFTIDLSPVFSPKNLICSTHDHSHGLDSSGNNVDEDGKDIKSGDSIPDKDYNSGSFSLDVEPFLIDAQEPIKHLQEPSKACNTGAATSEEKDERHFSSTSDFNCSSKNAVVEAMNKSETPVMSNIIDSHCGERHQFPCENNDICKTEEANLNKSNSIVSLSDSDSVQVQGKMKCSLLRTYLEKPKESTTLFPSTLSSLLVSREQKLTHPSSTNLSKATTSLLPKDIVYNNLSLQNFASPSRPHVCIYESSDKSCCSIADHKHSQNLSPGKLNSSISSSSHLPVHQIVVNKDKTNSSSELSSISSLPLTLILNTTLSSPISSSKSLSCSSTAQTTSSMAHNININSSSSALSSQLPSTSNIDIDIPTTCSPNYAMFRANQDLELDTLYQSLEVRGPETKASSQMYNFADIPNTSKTPLGYNKHQRGRVQTSEINLGDYFTPGTYIPASSIRIITQQGQNGSEVVMHFGFDQNNRS